MLVYTGEQTAAIQTHRDMQDPAEQKEAIGSPSIEATQRYSSLLRIRRELLSLFLFHVGFIPFLMAAAGCEISGFIQSNLFIPEQPLEVMTGS